MNERIELMGFWSNNVFMLDQTKKFQILTT